MEEAKAREPLSIRLRSREESRRDFVRDLVLHLVTARNRKSIIIPSADGIACGMVARERPDTRNFYGLKALATRMSQARSRRPPA